MIWVEFGNQKFFAYLESKEVITVSNFSKHFYENITNFGKYMQLLELKQFQDVVFIHENFCNKLTKYTSYQVTIKKVSLKSLYIFF